MTGASAPPRRTTDDWPPTLVILAGVAAFIGAAPGALFGAAVLLTGGLALYALTSPVVALACVVLPWLLVAGSVRLMTQRSRWPLISAGLPVTALALWFLLAGKVWLFLLVLGPAVSPLLALAPSVGSWLAERPFRVR